ncbi:MAG: ArsR/SmtB family transcription factor [Christensenellales bacterium]|jgi:ArsR family transcriptional regulator
MSYQYAEYVPVIKALSDETRLRIVDMLSCGEMCACKILEQFSITQPTLSYHMKILTECGIVTGRRDGSWMYYNLNKEREEELLHFLTKLLNDKEDCICKQCK